MSIKDKEDIAMKVGRFILKLVAALAALAAAAYLIKTYWETLEDIFYCIVGKIKALKEERLCCCSCDCEDEYGDFEDTDSEPVV